MASVFGHILVSSTIGVTGFSREASFKALLLAGICAAIPDADVLAFRFGIPYTSIWGHRGWTHSLTFALVFGTAVAGLFYGKTRDWWKMALWFVLATASHPLLDMLTTGGRGCALWWPFSDERLFFPVRVIQVSPLGARAFFSEWGLSVLYSEAFWIGLPCLVLLALRRLLRITIQAT
ncbi:MAG: metal-dependent hydrolase [Saprospiraceae bacterium]|nr:metal-dependent hydrolase [Lewinellaceae bacterium]